jgi:hypothetical protein
MNKRNLNKERMNNKQREIENLVSIRRHHLISGTYINTSSRFIVFCPIHNKQHETTLINYSKSKLGIPCCSKPKIRSRENPPYHGNTALLSEEQKLEKHNQTLEKAEASGHTIEGTYHNRFSPIKVYCTIHKITSETCYYNYNRSVSGVRCCQNFDRNSRGGQPRGWRRTSSARHWRNEVLKIWGSKCAMSGKTEKEAQLVCHHFFNAMNGYAFNTKNAIVILKEIHEDFHSIYGYTKNTLGQFIEYVSKQKAKNVFSLEILEKLEKLLKTNYKDILESLSQ